MKCPWDGCSYESSDMGVKVHHVQKHGESLAQAEYECDECGKVDTRPQSRLTGENQYCSIECRAKADSTKIDHQCAYCGTEFKIRELLTEKHDNNFCSPECAKEYNSGENHYNWNGGVAEFTGTKKGREWRNKVFERDDYTCQDCGKSGSETYLNAHHIKRRKKYPELSTDVDNGLTLCESCHAERHKGEQAYHLIKSNMERR